jgi:hypothetical protein
MQPHRPRTSARFNFVVQKGSEQEFERQLADTWLGSGSCYSTEASCCKRLVRIGQIDSIENVEELGMELKPKALAPERKSLESSHVPVK